MKILCSDTGAEMAAEATEFFDSLDQQAAASCLAYDLSPTADTRGSPDLGNEQCIVYESAFKSC